MFPRRPGHLRDFNYLGPLRYFLTFATHQRRQHFTDEEVVSLIWSQFLRAARDSGFEIPAFCFMPDHVHLVALGTSDTSDLLAFIRRAKQLSGYYFSRRCKQRLWQPDGYEHVLRDNEATGAVIRYIVANPVRAGLVSRLEAYPHFGSTVYSREDLIDFLQFPGSWEP
ncbi:MAG: REP-associated tyrosine transposase [Vicinamibacterales bacterium]